MRPRVHQLVLGAAKDESDGCPGRAHVALGEEIEHLGNGFAAAEDVAPVLGKRTLVAYPPIELEIERDDERAEFHLTAPSVPGGRSANRGPCNASRQRPATRPNLRCGVRPRPSSVP